MTSSSSTPTLPLWRAMEVLAQCSAALATRPTPHDLAMLVSRGEPDVARAEAMLRYADPAWFMIAAEEDRRVLFLVHAMLSDEDVARQAGPLPPHAPSLIKAVVQRIAPRMRSVEALRERLLHEELARGIAAAFDLLIEEENEATSRFMLTTLDETTKMLEHEQAEYERALRTAKLAIDTKHRPARPYGE